MPDESPSSAPVDLWARRALDSMLDRVMGMLVSEYELLAAEALQEVRFNGPDALPRCGGCH